MIPSPNIKPNIPRDSNFEYDGEHTDVYNLLIGYEIANWKI